MTTTTRPDAVDLTAAAVMAASAVLIAEYNYRGHRAAYTPSPGADALADAAVELVDRVQDLAAYVAGLAD